MLRLTYAQIAEILNGKIIRENLIDPLAIEGVTTDSRNVIKGQLFIPLLGEYYDGHDYIEAAITRGARLIITQDIDKMPSHIGGILVGNTHQALIVLATYLRSQLKIPVIGITGSVGKTSAKEMLASILSVNYKVHKTQGNYNNDIGLPLTILNMAEDSEILILEMGMNHFGEIDLLGQIAKPNYGLITNIGSSHIENLGSKEGILKAKSELVPHIDSDGVVILNGDDSYLMKLHAQTHRSKLVGYGGHNDIKVIEQVDHGLEGTSAIVTSPLATYSIRINAMGLHMVYHALMGIIVAEALGMSEGAILQGIENYGHEKMRLNKINLQNGIIIINDAYNASVDSMKAALNILKNIESVGRKIAILGDMFEMGVHSQEGHLEVGRAAAKSNLSLLICIGNYSRYIEEAATQCNFTHEILYFEKQEDFLEKIEGLFLPMDIILVKASRGMHLEHTVEKIKEVNL